MGQPAACPPSQRRRASYVCRRAANHSRPCHTPRTLRDRTLLCLARPQRMAAQTAAYSIIGFLNGDVSAAECPNTHVSGLSTHCHLGRQHCSALRSTALPAEVDWKPQFHTILPTNGCRGTAIWHTMVQVPQYSPEHAHPAALPPNGPPPFHRSTALAPGPCTANVQALPAHPVARKCHKQTTTACQHHSGRPDGSREGRPCSRRPQRRRAGGPPA